MKDTVERKIAAYKRAKKKLQSDQEKLFQMRIEMQLLCPHFDVFEVDSDCSRAPWRVCRDCGLAEGGWSCGHQVLKKGTYDVPRVGWETGNKLKEGPIHPNRLFVNNSIAQVLRGEFED